MAERTRATETPQPSGRGQPGRSTEQVGAAGRDIPPDESSPAPTSPGATEDAAGTGNDGAERGSVGDAAEAPDATGERSGDASDPDTGEATDGRAEDAPDGEAKGSDEVADPPAAGQSTPRPSTASPVDVHSGYKVTKRYRLEECITRLDGFSSWRAVDEKLRRAVGIHLLPAGHHRSADVLTAARSAALLGDPRFVQVLDADEHRGLVYVIHEWLPDATPLSTLLSSGPLSPYDSAMLVTQLSEAMATAHQAGLAHLRITPATVLRGGAGPFRIRGLAVDAALRGITHDHPARADTEAIGALLYAAQTQRWPYPEGAHGLRGMAGLDRGSRISLATPEQVRAGVHRELSDLTMRALANDGATATSEKPPCVTPAELAEAAAQLPRIPPPDPGSDPVPGCLRTSYQQGTHHHGHHPSGPAHPSTAAPPALPGRTGAAVKWAVSALLIAALGLGSWQIADALIGGDGSSSPDPTPSAPPPAAEDDDSPPDEDSLPIEAVVDFDPFGASGAQNPDAAPNAVDGDPDTFWHTKNYFSADLGNLKPGVGLVLDLGEVRDVSSVTVDLVGETTVELLAAPSSESGGTVPASYEAFELVDEATGADLDFTPEDSLETRYLLVWLTHLPAGEDGNYRGRVTSIEVSG